MPVEVLVESRMDRVAVVILLQLLLSGGVRGRRVCGKTGPFWTGAPPTSQQVGLQPWNQSSTGTQVTQSTVPGGLEVRGNVHSEDRTDRAAILSLVLMITRGTAEILCRYKARHVFDFQCYCIDANTASHDLLHSYQ